MFLNWFVRGLWHPSFSRRQVRPSILRKLARPGLELLEDRVLPSVYAVINTNDSGEGSLRQAILDANAHPAPNTIIFDIPGQGGHTIRPLSSLPHITNPVTIDATFQPGYAGTPLIVLDGSGAGANVSGLLIEAGNSTVRGLVVNNFSLDGIGLATHGGDILQNNYLGTDASGTQSLGNLWGVHIGDGVTGCTVGGTVPTDRNLLSGNRLGGVLLDNNTADNLVEGNYIGTDASGTTALGNGDLTSGDGGVVVRGIGNTIGGTNPGARNLLSGNPSDGIYISGYGNVVRGNFIGTDVTGTRALPNRGGVTVVNFGNIIGGTGQGAGNLISGNTGAGVAFPPPGDSNLVQGNYIGTDVTGTQALANGIGIDDSALVNTIGGPSPGAGNLISGNRLDGISIIRGGTVVQGNYIGTDTTGTLALPNGSSGVQVGSVATNTRIGGMGAGAGNLISGNRADGISVNASSGNVVQGNLIGTDVTGATALGNGGDGVLLSNAARNTIGGTTAAARNVISANAANGVEIVGAGATGNLVQGDYIGTDVTGTAALPNNTGLALGGGIYLNGSPGNVIGGLTATPGTGPGNVISGNQDAGILVLGPAATGNLMEGNLVGTDATGMTGLGNGLSTAFAGIRVGSPNNTVGGTADGARNIVSANGGSGIATSAAGTVVQGNYVGTDLTGTIALGNQVNGVNINDVDIASGTAHNLIGGTSPAAGNVISGNARHGLNISGSRASGNQVQGNIIGMAVTGAAALGNGGNGVLVALAADNSIGGTAGGVGNVIAYNGLDGVLVDTGTGNAIRRNSIFANGNLGIELQNHGNHDQPAPMLTSASSSGGFLTFQGTLTAAPLTTYTLEFFANTTADPSGFGQGERFIGFITVTTDANGNATFAAGFASDVQPGEFLSATATDPANNTSAFSQDVLITE
jgi:titin